MHQTAKVFVTGRSQAVRLPLEFRFDVPEVFIRHDPATGDVVLSRKPTDWQGLLDVVAQNKDEDVLIERRQTRARRDHGDGAARHRATRVQTLQIRRRQVGHGQRDRFEIVQQPDRLDSKIAGKIGGVDFPW